MQRGVALAEVNGNSKSTNERGSSFVVPVKENFVLPWLL
jgi:hypothetical protein